MCVADLTLQLAVGKRYVDATEDAAKERVYEYRIENNRNLEKPVKFSSFSRMTALLKTPPSRRFRPKPLKFSTVKS